MLIHPVVFAVALVLIFAAGVGWREAVRWARGEMAFTRAIQGELDKFLDRYRRATGERVGVIDDVPPAMARPSWARDLPEPVSDPGEYEPSVKPWDDDAYPEMDDEDAFPRDEQRVLAGAWRRETVRGNQRQAVWPVNPVDTGRHHEADGRTRDLSAVLGFAHVESEVAAP